MIDFKNKKAPAFSRVHLTLAQENMLIQAQEELNKHGPMPVRQYARWQKAMKALPTAPKSKTINNTRKGFGPGELVCLDGFNAQRDLPAGWGLYPMWDSGGNCKLMNAATMLWTWIWYGPVSESSN